MIYPRRFTQLLMFTGLCLNSSFIEGMFSSKVSFFPYLDHRVSIAGAEATTQPARSLFLDSLKGINFSLYGSVALKAASDNPRASLMALLVSIAAMASYCCDSKDIISEERLVKIKNYLASKFKPLTESCFNNLPKRVQEIILFLKDPVMSLGKIMAKCILYNKKYGVLFLTCAGGGQLVGWPVTGYVAAGASLVLGVYASRFDDIENKMDENQKKTETIMKDNQAKTERKMDENQKKTEIRFDGVDNKLDKNHQEIETGLADVRKGIKDLDDKFDIANKNVINHISQEISDVKQKIESLKDQSNEQKNEIIQGFKKEIEELERLFGKNVEQKIKTLSEDLSKKIGSLSNSAATVENSVKLISDEISALKELTAIMKENSGKQGERIEELVNQVENLEKSLNAKVANIETSLKQIKVSVEGSRIEAALTKDEMLGKINDISGQLDSVLKSVEAASDGTKKVKERIDDFVKPNISDIFSKIHTLSESKNNLEVQIRTGNDSMKKILLNEMSSLDKKFEAIFGSVEKKLDTMSLSVIGIAQKQNGQDNQIKTLLQLQEAAHEEQKAQIQRLQEEIATLKKNMYNEQLDLKKGIVDLAQSSNHKLDDILKAVNNGAKPGLLEEPLLELPYYPQIDATDSNATLDQTSGRKKKHSLSYKDVFYDNELSLENKKIAKQLRLNNPEHTF